MNKKANFIILYWSKKHTITFTIISAVGTGGLGGTFLEIAAVTLENNAAQKKFFS